MRQFRLTTIIIAASLAGTVGCERVTDSGVNDSGTRIVRGNGGEPGSLDPALAEDIHAFNILIDLYEGLVTEDAKGNRVPGAAESWTVSDNRRVYRFRLREGLRWSNGDELTASDFVRGLRRAVSPDTASTYAFLLHGIEHFDDVQAGRATPEELGVVAESDSILRIHLDAPSDNLLAVLTQPIAFPAHVSGDITIGNGAYLLHERQADIVRLRRNPHFREADHVQVDEIVYIALVDPVGEFNAYRAGEVDVTHTIPSESYPRVREQFPDQVFVAPTLALYYLAFDMSEPPFDDLGLRRALTMAIDRKRLASLLGRGEQPACGIVPPGVDGHENVEYEWCANDRKKVRSAAFAAYAAAGYSREAPLRLRYVYDAGDPVHERVALAVSAMWEDVLGVETRLEKREWVYFLDTRTQRGEWDVMRFAWFGDYNGAHTFLDIFQSDGEQNLPGLDDETFDGLLRDPGAGTSDVERHLLKQYPVAPLYFFVSKHLVKPHIRGFESNVMDRHPSRYLRVDPIIKRH